MRLENNLRRKCIARGWSTGDATERKQSMTKDALDELVHDALADVTDKNPADFSIHKEGSHFSARILGITVTSVFQPIFSNLDGGVIGHEALLRPLAGEGAPVSPALAFAMAAEAGKIVTFDRVCRTIHLLNYVAQAPDYGFLFLNIHPKHVANVHGHGKVFERVLRHYAFPSCRVVLEITESETGEEAHLAEAVANYRKRDFAIAVDDFGCGHSNLDRLWRLQPDFLKLDLRVIQEASVNRRVRNSLTHLVRMLKELGAQTIIEGVETDEQAGIVIDAGIDYAQGFYYAKPLPLSKALKISTIDVRPSKSKFEHIYEVGL
jgi:EAL domain-containing protein (putative c-di-GMP-specific phosphodiesterase class I)